MLLDSRQAAKLAFGIHLPSLTLFLMFVAGDAGRSTGEPPETAVPADSGNVYVGVDPAAWDVLDRAIAGLAACKGEAHGVAKTLAELRLDLRAVRVELECRRSCGTSASVGGTTECTGPTSAGPRTCLFERVGKVTGFKPGCHMCDESDKCSCALDGWSELEGALRRRGARLSQLLLIGRADRIPFDSPRYGGNSGLAQARAAWLHEKLRHIDSSVDQDVFDKRTILLASGPLNVPCDDTECKHDQSQRREDRSVEVFACWGPKPPQSPRATSRD